MDVDHDFGPIELDVPLHVDNISSAVLDGVFSGAIDHGLGNMDILNIDDYGVTDLVSVDPKVRPCLDASVSPIGDVSTVSTTSTHGIYFIHTFLMTMSFYIYFPLLHTYLF
jgi:hypothetical protein